jgi:iron(III) transport system substrate-binding protein
MALLVLGLSGSALAAKPVLHMVTALDQNEAKIYIEAFEKATGITVEWYRMSAGEVVARLRAEAKNPQSSIWFGAPSSEFVAAREAGLLEPYKSPNATYLKAQQRDKDWNWTGFYFGAIGFGTNTEFLKKNNLKAPTSWNDLLKPEFKGQISLAYPYTSGTAYTVLATLVQMKGEDAAFEYLKKLDGQVHHYNTPGSACVTQAGLGEIGVGIAFSHDVMAKGISKGYPVTLSFPKEGTGFEIGGMAIVKGGPEPDLAHKFLDWMLTVEAQNLMQAWFRIPLNPKATVAPGAVTADEVTLFDYDDVSAGKNQKRLVEKWRLLTGK